MALESKQLILPITGMYCANCVSTIERNLKKVAGVESAVVNLASERALVNYDPAVAGLGQMVARVEHAGYGIATGEANLVLKRLADQSDAGRLEKLLQKLEGVLKAQVSLPTDSARVTYVPTIVTQLEIKHAVSRAGFEILELEGETQDAEANARGRESELQRRLLITGLIFTIPLFLFAMSMDFGILPMQWAEARWPVVLMFLLATPVQFSVGGQYYVGAYKALRSGSTNMDVLIVLGSSVAYFYSLLVMLGLTTGQVYFDDEFAAQNCTPRSCRRGNGISGGRGIGGGYCPGASR